MGEGNGEKQLCWLNKRIKEIVWNKEGEQAEGPVEWLCLIDGVGVYEKVQRYFRHLLRN